MPHRVDFRAARASSLDQVGVCVYPEITIVINRNEVGLVL